MGNDLPLTERERIALVFMDGKMWVAPAGVGRAIYEQATRRGGSNILSIGSAVLGRLRKRGLATFLTDEKLWRISKSGRAALQSTTAPEREAER